MPSILETIEGLDEFRDDPAVQALLLNERFLDTEVPAEEPPPADDKAVVEQTKDLPALTRRAVESLHVKQVANAERQTRESVKEFFRESVLEIAAGVESQDVTLDPEDAEKQAAELVDASFDPDQNLRDLVRAIAPHLAAAFVVGAGAELKLNQAAAKSKQSRIDVQTASQKSRDLICLSCDEYAAKYGKPYGADWVYKHLPGQHDQSTHGHVGFGGEISAGVDTSKWPAHNASAKWGMKKIAMLEDLAKKGDWDAVVAASYVPTGKSLNSYQKGVLKAQSNLMAQKADAVQQPPAGAEAVKPGLLSDSGWKQIGPQLGSQPGGTYTDPDGQKYYVKIPNNPERAHNEVLANKLYAAAGGNVVETHLVSIGGKPAVATKWESTTEANWNDAGVRAEAAKDFGLHAWLANWDAVGLGGENIQQTSGGKLKLIDGGGSLDHRAKESSGKKPFGADANEWDSLRNPSINPQAARVFKDMTPQQMIAAADKVQSLSLPQIKSIVEKYHGGTAEEKQKIYASLAMRQSDIANRANTLKSQIAGKSGADATATKPTQHVTPTGQKVTANPVGPTIPTPPVITSASNAHMQKKFDAIYEAAKSGNVAAVEAIATNATAKQTYSKKQHEYKMQVLAAMKNGGQPSLEKEIVKQTAAKPAVVKSTKIDPEKFPPKPKLEAKNKEAKNYVEEMHKLASAGDLEGLKTVGEKANKWFGAGSVAVGHYYHNLKHNLAHQLNPPPPPTKIDADYARATDHIGAGMTGDKRAGLKKIGYWSVLGETSSLPTDIPTGKAVDYTSSRMAELDNESRGKMSGRQWDMMREYTDDGYGPINDSLRNQSPEKLWKPALEAAQTVVDVSSELPAGIVLTRGIRMADMDVARSMANLKPGTVISDPGILSTSTRTQAVFGGAVQMRITTGAGVRGLPVRSLSWHQHEDEVLLPPNQRLMITGVRTQKVGSTIITTHIDAVALPYQEGQCCPP